MKVTIELTSEELKVLTKIALTKQTPIGETAGLLLKAAVEAAKPKRKPRVKKTKK